MIPTEAIKTGAGPTACVRLRRRTWTVTNIHDPHDSFEVKAVSYRSALAAALAELGWGFVIADDAAAEAVYITTDELTTCPRCGARTAIEDLDAARQRHTCLNCKHVFVVEFDDEEEGADDEV
jgi:rubredoxin